MESQEVFGAGGLSIYQREAWVEWIFAQVKDFVDSYGNKDVSTCTSLCVTSLKNSYVRGRVYPFINIPVRLRDQELLGLYEYCEQLPPSDRYIYCDFIVHAIYYAENKEPAYMGVLEARARKLIEDEGYKVLSFEDGMAAITVDRNVLEREEQFIILLKGLVALAIKIQLELDQKGVTE
jgi:hypothetical protein